MTSIPSRNASAGSGATSGSGAAEWAWSNYAAVTSGARRHVTESAWAEGSSSGGGEGPGLTADGGGGGGYTADPTASSSPLRTVARTIADELATAWNHSDTEALTHTGTSAVYLNAAADRNWTAATMRVNWSGAEDGWEWRWSTVAPATSAPPLLRHSHIAYTALTCLVLAAIILAAVVGNAFVIG